MVADNLGDDIALDDLIQLLGHDNPKVGYM